MKQGFGNWFKTFTCVKSMITFALTGCFIYLCICNRIDENQFMNVFFMVISFYFGSQWEKKKGEEEK